MNEPILCYCEGNFAYFTTQAIEDQWGDDWDDAPYEHNAENIRPHSLSVELYEARERAARHVDERVRRGWKPGTQTPLDVGELCRCESCVRGWNEDGTPKWEITKVAFDDILELPGQWSTNSQYSVQSINAGAVAWLSCHEKGVFINAGATLQEFIELVHKAGGEVYLPSVEVRDAK